MKIPSRLFDFYLRNPLFIDSIIIFCIWIGLDNFNLTFLKLAERQNQLNIFPYLISTDVSLAGFILAALTIIVTFKSNLKAKGIEEAENALELIFSTKHYESIVRVFKKSMIEFTFCFIFIFIVWTSSENYPLFILFKINLIGILVTSVALIRSLAILFIILNISNPKEPE